MPRAINHFISSIARLNAELPMLSQAAVTELVWLLSGSKEICRLTCGRWQSQPLIEGLAKLGLAAVQCDWAILPNASGPNYNYSNGGRVCDDFDHPGALRVIFAAADAARVYAANRAALDDMQLGIFLGYP